MAWVDRSGARVATIGEPGPITLARVSPDSRRVAYLSGEAPARAWLQEVAGGAATPLSSGTTVSGLAWGPTSDQIALDAVGPPSRLQLQRITGAREETPLAPTGLALRVADWSADGRYLLYEQDGLQKKTDIWLLYLNDQSMPLPAVSSETTDRDASFSHDSHWLAFVTNVDGRDEVFVRSFPVPSVPVRVSTRGGRAPRWGANDTELFFESPEGALLSAAMTTDPLFSASPPRALFMLNGALLQQTSSDGQRFFVLAPAP